MTIRKGSAGAPGKGSGRAKRPDPRRDGPQRSSTDAASAAEAPDERPVDLEVSEAVAHVVKLGYDVIAENIQQGREAAARFRHGKYRLRETPGEIEVAAQRLLNLARELSTTTFDVCDRLLRELAAQKPAPDRAKSVPPFRGQTASAPSVKLAKTAPAAAADTGLMKVTVLFEGAPKAKAHTASLARPSRPAAPSAVTAQPLAPSDAGGGKPITGVTFEADMSIDGILARVRVPKGQPKGFYSGLVQVKGDPIPLGVLTIELPE
jgi:hypothetical protein